MGLVNWSRCETGMYSPGAGEDDVTSSSSSRARFLRPRVLGPLFAADMLGRRGELALGVRGNVSGEFGFNLRTSSCCWNTGRCRTLLKESSFSDQRTLEQSL
jgi:hypothetical protein